MCVNEKYSVFLIRKAKFKRHYSNIKFLIIQRLKYFLILINLLPPKFYNLVLYY